MPQSVQAMSSPLTLENKLRELERNFKHVREWKSKYNRAKEYLDRGKKLLDPDERPGQLLEEALKASAQVIATILGTTAEEIEHHPYFAFHVQHFKVLAKVLNATSKGDRAVAKFDEAVAAAKNICTTSTDILKRYDLRKRLGELNGWLLYWRYYKTALNTHWRNDPPQGWVTPEVEYSIQQSLMITNRLLAKMDSTADKLLQHWALLFQDLRALEDMMDLYNKKVDEMENSKSNFDRVFGALKARRAEDARTIDVIYGDKPEVEANPLVQARISYGAVDKLAVQWMEAADRAHNGEPIFG